MACPPAAATRSGLHHGGPALGYTFKKLPMMREATVYVDASNLLNKAPPFVNAYATNGAVGYDGLNANPLGRVVNVGLRSKF
jgi:iron complex outermembrane receptor protein